MERLPGRRSAGLPPWWSPWRCVCLRLDGWALDADEAARAYDAWVLFRGQPPVAGESIPDAGALLLLLEGIGFFLFGTSDVVARLVPALAGLAIVALPLALRRWVGGPAALGMAALAAISPTLVYASRVVSPEIVIAALALAAVACLVRLGEAGLLRSTRGPAIALGIVTGAAYAAGPSAISVMVSVIVGVAIAALSVPDGTIRRGLGALRRELPAFLLATVVTIILCFTRFLSYPPGIAGVGETLGAWWRLLTESSGQPAALFLMALLVYESIAVVFAIAAAVRDRGDRGDAVASVRRLVGGGIRALELLRRTMSRARRSRGAAARPAGRHRPRQDPARDRLARCLARQWGAAGPAHARHRGRAGGGRRAPHPGRRPGRRARGRAASGRRALPGGRATGLSGLAHDRRRAAEEQAARGNQS